MAFVPIPGTMRCVLHFQQFTDERQTVIHVKKDSGDPVGTDLRDVAQALADWWEAVGNQGVSNTLALYQVTVTAIHVANGSQFILPVTPPIYGTGTDSPEPGNVTSTISWRSAITGRTGRGRTYYPGYTDTDTNPDGSVTSAKVFRLAIAAANLLFGSLPSGMRLAIRSGVDAVARIAESAVVEAVLDSQRRRLPKRGI